MPQKLIAAKRLNLENFIGIMINGPILIQNVVLLDTVWLLDRVWYLPLGSSLIELL